MMKKGVIFIKLQQKSCDTPLIEVLSQLYKQQLDLILFVV